ncbi:MAG TPA: peptide chain release factor N(5)-glutamine methyltransferase [Terracidiphilus sp.]|jgi:release factor glutamine methyltransferase|nr:peptide chain release factor N(5)-glutamine methyltransferase [Terracidiphilus sp.]
MTLEEWVRKGEALLRTGPHPDRARRDAELLLRHLLQQERAALLARWKERLHENEAAEYLAFLERRHAGEPIQYITAEAEFYGLLFRVTRDVLIPRPETEHLVEKVIALCGGMQRPRIVDVGTGSGAIAVALAHGLPDAQITATDLSAAALEIARENAAHNRAAERIRFVQGDLLHPVAGDQFDVVASNPPYVSTADGASLAVEVRDYEPEMALFAGSDGMRVYKRLIPQAVDVLVRGGHIALEIGYGQQQAVGALLAASGYHNVEFAADLQGIPRVAVARRS